MEIFRDKRNGKLWFSQQKYVENILSRFGMNNVKLVLVPFSSHFKLSSSLSPSTKEEKEYMSRIPYADAVGSLMYAMVSTRPYISHAVGVVSRYMENPGKEHQATVKWVLQYLRGTSDYCITYNCGCELVYGYVDSNFAGDLDKRRLTSGYVFTLAGGSIRWMSKLSKIVALSTT
jgi:ATP-binding cassette subfamily B (MDR/TAP) protein 1